MTYETGQLAPNDVRGLFDRIAPVYDAMNRVMTAGLDRAWRRLTVEAVVQPGDRVLDACCGTGDLAIAAEREGGIVTGLDFSPGMLERARRKSDTVTWVEGDLLALPFEDGAFDAATVGFGVRNVDDLEAGLARAPSRAAPGRAARDPRDHDAARRPPAVLLALVRPDRARCSGRCCPAARRTRTSRPACGASRRRRTSSRCSSGRASSASRFRLLGGSIVALHVGVASGAADTADVEPEGSGA